MSNQKYSGKIRRKITFNFLYIQIIMIENDSMYYLFRVVDSHWVCINHQDEKRVLCDFLKDYGFGDLPDWIYYCLADNDHYRLKYRLYRNNIHIYLTKLTPYE